MRGGGIWKIVRTSGIILATPLPRTEIHFLLNNFSSHLLLALPKEFLISLKP